MDKNNKAHTGKAWKVGRHFDTDQILPSQYMLFPTIEEMAKHALEGIRPDFIPNVRRGDLLVGDENFGCGSSREQAPRVLKYIGIETVIAKSFASIFFRNAINIGLPVIVLPDAVDRIREGDRIEISFEKGVITNKTQGETYTFPPFPEFLMGIIKVGGLLQYAKSRS
ncbi:MAG: 3-isopropylmalate dehydratase small subunit [Nitrospirae bacterium]|nr:3-isopropylmalate dehydratase small subunit [Nitrospirota bacterium]